jgi:pimeloyl-ACP methyl ester carboxylesterase
MCYWSRPSIGDAAAWLQSRPLFAAWDPRALKGYLEGGFGPVSTSVKTGMESKAEGTFAATPDVSKVESIQRRRQDAGDTDLIAAPQATPVSAGGHAAPPQAVPTSEGAGVGLKCAPATEAAYYRGAGPTIWPQLNKIGAHAPTRVLAGEKSTHMDIASMGGTLAVFQEMVRHMGPMANLSVVSQCSHFLVMERPDVIAQHLAALLSLQPDARL